MLNSIDLKIFFGTSTQPVPTPSSDAWSKPTLTWHPPGQDLSFADLQIGDMVYAADYPLY